MLKRNFYVFLATLVMISILASCGPLGTQLKDVVDMTPKEKASWMIGVYNTEAEDYKRQVARPGLTEPEKDTLRKKKTALTQAWNAIAVYDSFVQSGVNPSKEVEMKAMGMIDALVMIVLPYTDPG